MKLNGSVITGVEMGDGFLDVILAPVPLKEFISNDSRLEHGTRVIVSNPKKSSRELTLQFVLYGDTPAGLEVVKSNFMSVLYTGNVAISEISTDYTDVFHLVYQNSTPSYGLSLDRCTARMSVKFTEPNPSNRS